MRGIPEERLIELVNKICEQNDDVWGIAELLKAVEELNQWQPIETAPLNITLRLFKRPGYQIDGELYDELDRQFYSHWQYLPEDPK